MKDLRDIKDSSNRTVQSYRTVDYHGFVAPDSSLRTALVTFRCKTCPGVTQRRDLQSALNDRCLHSGSLHMGAVWVVNNLDHVSTVELSNGLSRIVLRFDIFSFFE